MKKIDFGIFFTGYDTYVSFVIYKMANGKYKCYKNLSNNSDIYDKYKWCYDSVKVREKKLTSSGRQGINRIFYSYKDSIKWVWDNR